MTSVFNAMLNGGAKRPMNANAAIKIISLIAVGLILVLASAGFGWTETIKFRHITSIYSDDQEQSLKHPEGVACNQNTLIVADTGNARLLQYRFADNNLQPKTLEIKLPQLIYPRKININSRQEIYVLDGKQRRIIRMTRDGKFSGYFDPQGLPAPAKHVPRSFHIDRNDNLYILDIFSERVLVLDPQGQYRKQIKFPKDYGFFSDVAVDMRGNILLLDSVNARVFSTVKRSSSFSPLTENLKEYMRFPTSLAVDQRSRIYVVDRNGSKMILLAQDGSILGRLSAMGWKEGLLNYPAQICLNGWGNIFVADTKNSRVQVFAVIE